MFQLDFNSLYPFHNNIFNYFVSSCYPPFGLILNGHHQCRDDRPNVQSSSESVSSKPTTPFDKLKEQVAEIIWRMEKDVNMRQPMKEVIHKGPTLDLVEDCLKMNLKKSSLQSKN